MCGCEAWDVEGKKNLPNAPDSPIRKGRTRTYATSNSFFDNYLRNMAGRNIPSVYCAASRVFDAEEGIWINKQFRGGKKVVVHDFGQVTPEIYMTLKVVCGVTCKSREPAAWRHRRLGTCGDRRAEGRWRVLSPRAAFGDRREVRRWREVGRQHLGRFAVGGPVRRRGWVRVLGGGAPARAVVHETDRGRLARPPPFRGRWGRLGASGLRGLASVPSAMAVAAKARHAAGRATPIHPPSRTCHSERSPPAGTLFTPRLPLPANLSFRVEPAAPQPRHRDRLAGSRGIYSAPPTRWHPAPRPLRREPRAAQRALPL